MGTAENDNTNKEEDQVPNHLELSEQVVGEVDGVTFTGDDLIGTLT